MSADIGDNAFTCSQTATCDCPEAGLQMCREYREFHMGFAIDPNVYRHAGRDIIKVVLLDRQKGTYSTQPMYRSTGHNSGMPGTWLPFDGIAMGGTWFDKTAYCLPECQSGYHRFGTEALKRLSDALGDMSIAMGVERHPDRINEFLGVS